MSSATKKSQYRVNSLKESDLSLPWFSAVPRDYKTKTVVFQRSMEKQYKPFSEWVNLLLNHVDESRQIRRFMPKTEWTAAYYVRVAVGQKAHNYLLILGAAEVSTKPKSMAYGEGRDHYDCQNCYYVLGSKELMNEEKFGKPSGERQVRERTFYEYNTNRPEAHELVLRLMKIVMAKENIKIENPK